MTDYIQKVKPIKELLSGIKRDLETRTNIPKLPIKTLPYFNNKVWGLQQSALTIIGARSSQGKSAFSLQLAYDLAEQKIPTLFLSLEMPAEALIERLFCNIQEVNNQDIQRGKFNQSEELKKKWDKFAKDISEIPLLITCGIGKNFKEVNELIKILEPKPTAIFVDFVQNISLNSKETREMINEYIRQFRQMTIEYNFAGVLCSQINRGAEQNKDNEPKMYQLKETGFLEESADQVWLLYWENFYNHSSDEKKYKILIAKNRNGRTGDCYIQYFPQYYKFTEIPIPNEITEAQKIMNSSNEEVLLEMTE